MASSHTTIPKIRYPLLAFVLILPLTIQAKTIIDSLVTPFGDTATLTHSHPAFGGRQHSKTIDPIELKELNNNIVTRNLEAELSDIARLEAFFGMSMENNFNVLKDSYASAVGDKLPWSGGYWPTYKDGINAAWQDGEASPAEKYAKAFGINVDHFMSGISLSSGVLSETGTICIHDSDYEYLDDGSVCGIRIGESNGYCIPTWYGLCHAWAAATMLEYEPKCDVQKNNVTFHSMDMKALITQLYDEAAIDVVFTGTRFNGPDRPEERDEYGRYKDNARKDINPAFFHITIANIFGKQHQTFIVDISSDLPVRNQPVQKYEYLEAEIVNATALSLDYFNTTKYPFNDAAAFVAKCTTRLTWTANSMEDGVLTCTDRIQTHTVYEDYEYCLELDENYTIIGGEWLGSNRKTFCGFQWGSQARTRLQTLGSRMWTCWS